MSDPDAILSLVTLGVADLERSIAFYEALGFSRKAKKATGVGFFQAGAMTFAVWPVDELAKDANIASVQTPAFRGVALAWNCRSEAEVDTVSSAPVAPARRCPNQRRRLSGAAMLAISPIPTATSGKWRITPAFR